MHKDGVDGDEVDLNVMNMVALPPQLLPLRLFSTSFLL
jgi:hypothetical protein